MERVLRLPAVGNKRYLTNKVGHTGVIRVSYVCDMGYVCYVCVICYMCVCVNGGSAETAGRGQQTEPHQ